MPKLHIKKLIEICKTCEHRSPHDDMWFAAWWSFCQTDCKHMANVEKTKRNFEKDKKENEDKL